MGADVLLVGPLPTPAIAFLTTNMRADAGVVISLFAPGGIREKPLPAGLHWIVPVIEKVEKKIDKINH